MSPDPLGRSVFALLLDAADSDAVAAVHGEFFGAVLLASTFVVVRGLLDSRRRVEIEADALLGR